MFDKEIKESFKKATLLALIKVFAFLYLFLSTNTRGDNFTIWENAETSLGY